MWTLRLLVYLKHISIELKRHNDLLSRANELTEIGLKLAYPNWGKSGKVSGAPKMVEVSHPTPELWNREYRKHHPEAELE